MTKGSGKSLGNDGYVHYLECEDVSTGVYTYVKTYQAGILIMCSLFYVNYTSMKKCKTIYFLSILYNLDFSHVILSMSFQQCHFHQNQLNNFEEFLRNFKVVNFM